MKGKKMISLLLALVMILGLCTPAIAAEETGNYTSSAPDDQGIIYVTQEGGPTLGYNERNGDLIIEEDGYAFKDLNGNGELDDYEDWRLSTKERADDLAQKMVEDGVENGGIQSIAGLMLYSSHTSVYGPNIEDAGSEPGAILEALEDEYLRHVLVTTVSDAGTAAAWSNEVQAHVEGLMYGIPTNNSSDPRHAVSDANVEYYIDADGNISMWPASVGMAATFDPDLVEEFGYIAAEEYRALGISTALSPQVDLATDPRWNRSSGSFGEDSALATDMARAYVDGFQTTPDSENGWGDLSVNAMVKHWPGGGTGEGGRDAHYNYGKFAVYPGDNMSDHLLPFTEGAFKLNGETESASAVMPYYTISWDQDTEYGENVGNAYSRYIIADLLRDEYAYEGVVCTDWGVVTDIGTPWSFGPGTAWGMEGETKLDRYLKLIRNGVDQFGGVNQIADIMEAYEALVEQDGQTEADARMKQSAVRLLTNIFNAGLFENPYLDVEESAATVGSAEYMAAGYTAQQKSVVMLKNEDDIIAENGLAGKTVYVDEKSYTGDAYGVMTEEDIAFYESYFAGTDATYTTDIDEADVVIAVMTAPIGGGYSSDDYVDGGNGYLPISLQYGSYTAEKARETSIAANPDVYFGEVTVGDTTILIEEDVEDRSYLGKTYESETNLDRLADFEELAESVDVPVIVYMRASNPMVWSEVEPLADAIVVGYSIQKQAALDVITGAVEPSGMLPMQQPANMDTVETQYEDVPHDMLAYIDSTEHGHVYDFGYGLNWSGIIGVESNDDRWNTYVEDWRLPFTDVTEADWFYAPVYFGYTEGMFIGTSDTTFSPAETTTRAMFIANLGRYAEMALGVEMDGEYTFLDIEEGAYYEKYVGWANENGVIKGYDEDTFGPEDEVTREQMAAMIVRFAKHLDMDLSETQDITFTDEDEISDYFYDEIMEATRTGLIRGYEDGSFDPQGRSQRSHMAQVLMNFLYYNS